MMIKIQNLFFKNLLAKITCVLLAVVFWIYVGTGLTKNANFPGEIPLKAKNVPQGLVAVLNTDKISVKVMAENDVYQKLTNESFNAYVDLNGLKEGTHNVKPIVTVNVANVAILETNPDEIVVSIEPSISKEVPVSALITGKAGNGLVAGQSQIDPGKVTVTGARSVIASILSATAKIELSGQTSDFKQIVKLTALNSKGEDIKGISFSPAEVIVNVPIVKASNVKTVGIKVNTIGTVADGYWISEIQTEPKTITITAAEGTITQTSFIGTAEVSINGLNKNTTTKTTLAPPPGVSILDNVSQISVSITISKNQASKEIQVGFKPQGLAGNLKITSYDPDKATVVVTGPQEILKNISSGDIIININLSGINQPGTFSVDISRSDITGPTGVSVASIVPSAINVRIDTK